MLVNKSISQNRREYTLRTVKSGVSSSTETHTSLPASTTLDLDSFKWATDYFIKCHVSADEFYAQLGDGYFDQSTLNWVMATSTILCGSVQKSSRVLDQLTSLILHIQNEVARDYNAGFQSAVMWPM